MNETNFKKLPIINIIIASMTIALREKAKFSKALAIPTLILVVLWAISHIYFRKIAEISVFIPSLFYILGITIFAVTCHRLVLADARTVKFVFEFSPRLLRFSLRLILVYLILYLVAMIPMTVLLNLSTDFRNSLSSTNYSYAMLLFSIPAMYVVGRLSLVFPAIAIDHNLRFKESWALTRHNGWRMAIIIGFYPWVVKTLISLLAPKDASSVVWVLLTLLYYYAIAMLIFALSLSYKELKASARINGDN